MQNLVERRAILSKIHAMRAISRFRRQAVVINA